MKRIFIAAMFMLPLCATAQDNASEPAKVEYLKCLSLMEKSASSTIMAFSSREKVDALKVQLEAHKCLTDLTPRIRDEKRLHDFQNVENIWRVAITSPSALANMEYIKTAQGFLYTFD